MRYPCVMTLIQRDESQTIGEAARVAASAVPYAPYGTPGFAACQEGQRAVEEEFKALLHAEYGVGLYDAAHERIYTKAEEDGHASGWEAIESEYETLARLALDVLSHYDISYT